MRDAGGDNAALSGAELIGETLRAMHAEFESRVRPFIAGAEGEHAAWMISDLLVSLAAWHSAPEPGAEHDSISPDAVLAPVGLATVSEYAERAVRLQAEIERAVKPALVDLASAVETEGPVLSAENRLVQAIKAEAPARLARVETAVTAERALALIEACAGPGHSLTEWSRVPGGFSKDSFFLTARAADGAKQQFILRRDLPYGPGENTVADEFKLLAALRMRGLPIAEPLGCDLTGIVGTPALLSRRVPGNSGTSPWDEDEAARRAICFQMAEFLATLHGLAPTEFDLPNYSSDPREQLRGYVAEWRDRWRRNRVHASPTLAAAFDWLIDHVPQTTRLSIVHGDVGFHNALVCDGKLTAVVDWEFAHAGDPTEDLGYCRPVIEALVPWDEFLAAYRAAGGGDYAEENAQFFELWRSVRNAVCCATSWRGFVSGRYPALKMAYQGIPLYRGFVLLVASKLLERLGLSRRSPQPSELIGMGRASTGANRSGAASAKTG